MITHAQDVKDLFFTIFHQAIISVVEVPDSAAGSDADVTAATVADHLERVTVRVPYAFALHDRCT